MEGQDKFVMRELGNADVGLREDYLLLLLLLLLPALALLPLLLLLHSLLLITNNPRYIL